MWILTEFFDCPSDLKVIRVRATWEQSILPLNINDLLHCDYHQHQVMVLLI